MQLILDCVDASWGFFVELSFSVY